jgi:threonine dehydratase
MTVDRAFFERARARIEGRIVATRVLLRPDGLRLKLECEQVTGSFKARGALNRVLALSPSDAARGIVTASGGNHGLAVAYAGHSIGIPTTIYLPMHTSAEKAARMADWNARVVRHGEVWDDAHGAALEEAARTGATYVHPFADPDVVAGQGTIALELEKQAPEIDALIVAIGGGGLIAGVAAAARLIWPQIRVIGVEPVGAPTLVESLRANDVVTLARIETKAGTLAPRRSDRYVFDIIKANVDQIALVTDDEMKDAARWLKANANVGVELSGAAAVAAYRTGKANLASAKHPCALVCGAGKDYE